MALPGDGYLESRGLAANTINQQLAAVRRIAHEAADAGLDKFEREKLREPEQLPNINADGFTLVWDNDHSNPDDRRTLIKHGETVIFSEPARYEEYERFAEVADILKARYGHRLKDLVPTLASEYWLYGDKYTAPDYVDSVREKIREQSHATVAGEQIPLF